MTTSHTPPKRGEIWQINLDPTVGVEMQKIRPVVVISSDAAGRLPIKLIAVWSALKMGQQHQVNLLRLIAGCLQVLHELAQRGSGRLHQHR